MKLVEVSHLQELDEASLKHYAAASATALALLAAVGHHNEQPKPLTTSTIHKQIKRDEVAELTRAVLAKYDIDKANAERIVKLAKKHEASTFPKAKDILAIIGIESSFNPKAVSGLKHDPAIGLTQVRPGIWNLDKAKLAGSVEEQIKVGADILKKYYERLHSKDQAVGAYNVGIVNFLRGKDNPSYVAKFKAELQNYTSLGI